MRGLLAFVSFIFSDVHRTFAKNSNYHNMNQKIHKLIDVALALGLSDPTIRRWIKQGKIKTVTLLNGDLRIPDGELQKLLAGEVSRK
jgi:excisionase family DNA binding protein